MRPDLNAEAHRFVKNPADIASVGNRMDRQGFFQILMADCHLTGTGSGVRFGRRPYPAVVWAVCIPPPDKWFPRKYLWNCR